MALIGTIAINMKVGTAAFVSGLEKSAAALKFFAKTTASGGVIVTSWLGRIGAKAAMASAGIAWSLGGMAVKAIGGLVDAMGSAISAAFDLGKRLLFFGVIAGGIALAAAWNMAQGAIALAEQTSRAEIVFGKFTPMVEDFAKKSAIAFGTSRREVIQFAAAFGTIFQGARYGEEESAKLSVHFVKLAQDLSSFAHIPVQEAMEKLQSGLSGQVRPLRELGIFMSEAEVDAYAYAHGIARLGAELTESEKVQARIGFLTDATAKAQGNLALTAGSAANQIRSLMGRFENLKDSIGTTLVGLLMPALTDMQAALHALQIAWNESGLAADKATQDAVGGMIKQEDKAGYLQKAIMWAADAWQGFKIAALDAGVAILNMLSSMAARLQEFARFMAPVSDKFRDMGAELSTVIPRLDLAAYNLKQMADTERAKPAASIAVAEAMARAREDIAKTRKEMAAEPKLDVTKIKPGAGEAKAPGVPKFASAMEAGSKEAANAVLRSKYGAGATGKGPADQTAKNTSETVKILRQIAAGRTGAGRQERKDAEFAGAALGALF